MSEEKQTPVGIILAIAAVVAVIVYAVSSGGGKDQQANNPEAPAKPSQPKKLAEPQEPAFMKEGLVAYYPFNGNAKDESGNENDGEVKGAALAADRHGESNQAYSFDGDDDFIEVADSNYLDLGDDSDKAITISVWINGPLRQNGCILRKATGEASSRDDYSVRTSSNMGGYIWGTGPSQEAGGNNKEVYSIIPWPESSSQKWNFLVAVYNAKKDEKCFYVNGELLSRSKSGKKSPQNNGPLRIGSEWGRGFWNGSIDDIRIYNRALTEEQVKALYEWEKPKAE